MIRHIILWKLKSEIPAEKVPEVKAGIKNALEALPEVIDGLISLKVHTEGLSTSTCDLMLESELRDEAALAEYKDHPAHVAVADGFVRPNVEVRLCLDFEA
ncbi:MAG: Dabb family protein [Ruminococcaceae bacterium]|nr:Dabb family protein [Oscillospiraceae bacterium]